LQQLAYRGQLHRVLSVLKLRFSAHDHSLREFTIAPPDGINVLSPLESGRQLLAALAGLQGGPVHEDIPPLNDSPLSER
jgi:circadian clock protein KaiC